MNRGPLLPRLLAALALGLALAALCLRHHSPPLPHPLTVDLVLHRGTPGQSEPLITSGRPLFGDFLIARYLDETTVVFGYNSWGHPGHLSTTPITLTPGQPLRLQIEMPALHQMRGRFSDPPGRIRVTCDGVLAFALTDHYFFRQPLEIYLGENPLGGTASDPHLRGQLLAPDGRELRGDPTQFFTARERLAGWLTHSRQKYAVLLAALAVLAGWIPLRWFRPAALREAFAALRRALAPHRWFAGTAAVATLAFTGMVTQGTLQFDVTEQLGSFYDYQADSLRHGRLDVTEDAIGGEAFVVAGKLYGYFGPTPALLRLPFVLFDFAFGNLTRAFFVGYFLSALIAAYALLRHACRLVAPTAVPSPAAVVFLTANLGLGSTLFFLGSRAYVYHEAIFCGVTFALFACLFALRHLATPTGRWWLASLLCAVLSLHARPPTGLFALTFLGCVAATLLGSALRPPSSVFRPPSSVFRPPSSVFRPLALGLACVLAVFTFNGLGYLKFGTFEGAPLRFSRPYEAARLAHIDGQSFHAANVPYGAYTYFVRPNLRFEPLFPFVYLGSPTPGREFPAAKLDLPDHTLAIPFAMPGLFFLTVLAAAAFARAALRAPLLLTGAAVLPMSLALFAAVATAQRYTADWLPFLTCAAAIGLASLAPLTAWLRRALSALVVVFTTVAVLLTFALTLHYQRETVWGVPEEIRQSYQQLRPRLTP